MVVEALCVGPVRPPAGSGVDVRVSDTSLADVRAPVVGETRANVVGTRSSWLVTVEVALDRKLVNRSSRLSVFAHVDVDGDERMSSGDFLTTQSFPIELAQSGETRTQATVVQS